MSWELRYQEEVMPVIEEYINEETSSFTSSDIAEFSEELEPDFVGRVLKHADTDSIGKIYSYFRNTLEIKNDQKIKGLITEYRERR